MRQFRQFFSILTAGILFVSSCSVKNNMLNNNYTVAPNPLEVKGDTVTITMSANIPAKSINPKANIQFQPYLKTAKGDIPLKAITVGGESVIDNVDFKISSKTGGKITYQDRIAYNPDMIRSTLYPDFSVKVGAEYKTIEGVKDSKVLAEGIVTTPLLVKTSGMPVNYDETPYTSASASKSVAIYFAQDQAKFNASFKKGKGLDNKAQINQLKELLKTNKDWQVTGISINAYASPDGELSRNEGLSKSRSENTFNYFKKELKKLGFSEVNDQNLKMGYSLSEDWTGYEKAVEATNHPDKDAVLAIVKNKGISDADREAQLRDNQPKFWKSTKETILPTLRKSEVVVTGQTPIKTDEELKAKMNDLNALTDVEMLHLGKISDNAGKITVYTAYIAKYPEDWKGYNDLGAAQLSGGNAAEGIKNLESANSKSPENPTVLANLGEAYLTAGDFAKAAEILKSATSKGANVSYASGVIAIKRGNYSEALSLLGKSGATDFNYALAQLLNGNNEGAKQTLDNMKSEDMSWECYYLRAIIGARTGNQDLISPNLTKAVQINANVRQHAKADVE
ncbi:MAG: tetratricopeptide repeat protein, partial [Bacteroidota bacterium]